jgi:hypothetical protein
LKTSEIEALLEKVASGELSIKNASKELETLPYGDLGYAMIDHHRAHRTGHPEVIYCEGKTIEQIVGIVSHMNERNANILATRASEAVYNAISEVCQNAKYNKLGRVITVSNSAHIVPDAYVAIVAAGTSDLPVVEEAYETISALGFRAEKVVDVGVAGIHRLFSKLDIIRGAKVVIVVAGMEGALASVLGGLVEKPLIAVPTSIGYGASFGGLSALLTMLNSCASGVTVVNIDNGFGAAFAAAQIMRL